MCNDLYNFWLNGYPVNDYPVNDYRTALWRLIAISEILPQLDSDMFEVNAKYQWATSPFHWSNRI